jgi:hypothetical protein
LIWEQSNPYWPDRHRYVETVLSCFIPDELGWLKLHDAWVTAARFKAVAHDAAEILANDRHADHSDVPPFAPPLSPNVTSGFSKRQIDNRKMFYESKP